MKLRTILRKISGLTIASSATYLYIKYFGWIYVVPSGLPSQLDYFGAGITLFGLIMLWFLVIVT